MFGIKYRFVTARGIRNSPQIVVANSNGTGNGVLPQLAPLDNNYERNMQFSSYANWVIKGRLMSGRYPYVEPSRCRDPYQGIQQLDEIMAQGIDTFICLQAELPSQKQLSQNGTMINGFLSYVSVCEEIAKTRTPKKDLIFIHEPIEDMSIPSQQQMTRLVDKMIHLLENDRNIYLHCWGGRGRAGTAGACLIAELYSLSSVEALARIQRAFDTRNDGGRQSPETIEQKLFVKNYVADLSAVSEGLF